MIRDVITPSLGKITGCFKSWGKEAFFNRPPTLRTPSCITGSSWNNWWFCGSLPWFSICISSLKTFFWANFTSTRLAFLLSSTLMGSAVFALFASFWIRATTFNVVCHFEKRPSLSRKFSSSTFVCSACITLTSGSPTISCGVDFWVTISLSHRNFGPVNHDELINSATLSPLEAWSAGFWSVSM